MNTTTFIRDGFGTSRGVVLNLLNDLRDHPLVTVSGDGGNHALWILGHLVYIESFVVNTVILGHESGPHDSWRDRFGTGSRPVADAGVYPSFDSLLETWDEVRAFTLATLDRFCDDDLDKPAPGCPEEHKAWFGTIGKAFGSQIMHPMMHYGQLADIRRSLGRDVLMV